MDIQTILELIGSAIGGGGLVAYFLIPEKKASKRLDNAERLIAKYDPIIERLEKEIGEKDEQIKSLIRRVNTNDSTIAELRAKMRSMEIIAREDKVFRCENINCKKRRPPIDKEQLDALAK